LTVSERVVASSRPAGTVVAQSPLAGTAATGGTAIAVDVSGGPALPNVVGLTAASARRALTAGGWTPTIVMVAGPPGPAYQHGRVWAEAPTAGTALPTGSTVNLNVEP
jgi:serine/threonine-protein kinase